MVESADVAPRCDSQLSGAKCCAVLVDPNHGARAAASTLAIATETDSPALRAEDNAESDGQGLALRATAGRAFPARLAHRVLAAADADRRRIERDLHDGVQQHLTGLRIRRASVAADFQKRGGANAGCGAERVWRGGRARDRGGPFVRARRLSRSARHERFRCRTHPVSCHALEPVTVSARAARRCRPEVESAVYFMCRQRWTTRPSTQGRRRWPATYGRAAQRCRSRCAIRGAGVTQATRRLARPHQHARPHRCPRRHCGPRGESSRWRAVAGQGP